MSCGRNKNLDARNQKQADKSLSYRFAAVNGKKICVQSSVVHLIEENVLMDNFPEVQMCDLVRLSLCQHSEEGNN